jgi:hypothetical protein
LQQDAGDRLEPQEMRFALVSDTREWSEPRSDTSRTARTVDPEEVLQEARRRKALLNLDEWRLRQYVTDRPVPDHIVQMCRQIDLAAAALARLSPIPTDFGDDLYWPRTW